MDAPPHHPMVPSTQQIDLFRAVEDIHELTGAIVVLLTDRDGVAIAVAGDEDEFPMPLRAVLGGEKLARAGSVRALLEPLGDALSACPLNFSLFPVAEEHLLAIAFDVEASLDTVQTVGGEGARLIEDVLRAG